MYIYKEAKMIYIKAWGEDIGQLIEDKWIIKLSLLTPKLKQRFFSIKPNITVV